MAETIDQQFIEYIVKALVGNPDAVKVDRTIDEKGVLLELHVDPSDLGRVIGRNGATAKSIRILLRALGVKNDARYNLKIIDNGDGGHRRDEPARDDYARPAEEPTSTAAASSDDAASQPAPDVTSEPVDQTTAVDEYAQPHEDKPADETPAEAPAEPAQETPNDMVSRSRKELEDLNDLDI